MTSRKRYLADSNVQHPRPGGVVDMELDCVICGMRLYVSDDSIDAVLTSLEQKGAVILICPIGHAQLVRRKTRRSRNRND